MTQAGVNLGMTVRLLALLLAGWPGQTQAAATDLEGLPVAEIQFQPETQPLPQTEIARLLPIEVGKPLEGASVREAIERLYASGRYLDIQVNAEPTGNGVRIVFVTKATWFIGRVTVDGVPEPPNRGQLISSSKLELGREYTESMLAEAETNIQQRLKDNGFYQSKIDTSTSYQPGVQQINFDFAVDPGQRADLAKPVVQGVPPSDMDRIIDASKWQRLWGLFGWKTLTEARLHQGLERVRNSYSKDDYLLSRVRLTDIRYEPGTETATPVLDIERGPKVHIRVEGADVSEGDLRKLIPVYQEQSADRDLLVEGMRNLTEFFQSDGYFNAQVTFTTRSESDGSETVLYDVDRGERYKLVKLEIQGNRYFRESTLRERMNTQPATFVRYRWGRFSRQMLENDLNSIRELYVSNGFRNVDTDWTREDNYEGKPNQLAVTVTIDEGPQWLVGKMQLDGVDSSRQENVESLIGSVDGQPFSEVNLATDRDAVLRAYYNDGFQDANCTWDVSAGAEPNTMDVRFVVTEGMQQFVRGFVIGGLKTSDPDMVLQRIALGVGEPLSQAALIETQRRLYDLGIFARVDMAQQNPDGAERNKYVLYQFEEARKYSLNLGFGAEVARIGGGGAPNFDAPAGEPGFSPRISIGLSRSNLFGVGHTVGIQTRVSNIQQRALGTYLAPQFKGSENTSLTVSLLFDVSKDIRTFTSRRQEGSIQLSQRLSRANTLQGRFTYRRNTVGNLAIDEDLIPILARPVRVGIISGTYIQDRRDDPIDAHRGYYNSIDLGLASKVFASETDFGRILARNSTYHQLGGEWLFARTITIGWIHNLGSGGPQAIPLPERFFAGGPSSHRGFPDNQAGPRDLKTGFPLGGSALFVNSLELRFPLLGDNIGGVFFHDMGNVYTRMRMLSFRVKQRDLEDFNYMVHAVGFGIRYRTPVGPVRVDLAFVPNPPRFSYLKTPDGGGPGVPTTDRISRFQFHFSLGQAF